MRGQDGIRCLKRRQVSRRVHPGPECHPVRVLERVHEIVGHRGHEYVVEIDAKSDGSHKRSPDWFYKFPAVQLIPLPPGAMPSLAARWRARLDGHSPNRWMPDCRA